MKHAKNLERGGVNPPDDSLITRSAPITNAAVPSLAVIPMLQHAGAPARCLVAPGDLVREGMLIGRAEGPRSANVHSSIPGRVVEIREMHGPGAGCQAVVVELGGEFDRSGRIHGIRRWDHLKAVDLLEKIQAAGVVGLGGELMPTHLKLAVPPGRKVALFAANGVDGEPSLSADYALMREKPAEIVEAMRICRSLLEPQRTVLAIGEGSQELAHAFESLCADLPGFEVAIVPSRYPLGNEELLVASLSTGETGRPKSDGATVVLNVATLYAIYEAIVLEKPLIDRVVTVSGLPVASPRNVKARVGTRIGDLFDECGGLDGLPGKIVIGGPMRGVAIASLDEPVTKAAVGVTVFSRAEARTRREWPCIRCGACIEACPWELEPTRLAKLIRQGAVNSALRDGLARCTECGCCAFACPSRIPLAAVLAGGKLAGLGAQHG
jgi:electron transport complex protein RnfC